MLRRIAGVVLFIAAGVILTYGIWFESNLYPQVTSYPEHEQRLKADHYSRLIRNNKPEVIEKSWQQMVSSGAVKAHWQSFQRMRQTRVLVWGMFVLTLGGGILFVRMWKGRTAVPS